jgi:hypothetical protein
MKQDFEYIRHGDIDVMAGFDIRTGKVFAGFYRRHRSRKVFSFLKRLVKHYGKKKILFIMENL